MIDALGGLALAPLRARLDADDRDPEAAQARVLAAQAKALSGTEVAKLQDPRIWTSPAAWRRFVRRTGAVHYAELADAGLADPRPGRFEASATLRYGRTGSGRAVPYTRAHRRAFEGLQLGLAASLPRLGVGDALLGSVLLVQGGLGVSRTAAGVVHGYSASLALDALSWPMTAIVAPAPGAVGGLDDAARVGAIRDALLRRRPKAITGVPSGVVAVIRALLADDDGRVREALRRIRVYGWSGMPLGPYAPLLSDHFAPGCAFVDVASATEGPIGWPEGGAHRLAWGLGLFGFAAPGDDRLVGPAELTPGRWELVIGAGSGWQGFWGGDIVEVIETKPVRVRLLPRGVDVDALAAAVGHERFRVALSGADAEVLLEAPAGDRAALTALLGPTARFVDVAVGSIDRAALAAPKLPWVFRDPGLRAAIVRG